MNPKIDQIINELIQLDPEFTKHKLELEKILTSIVALKPDPIIDSAFVSRLKLELSQKISDADLMPTKFNFKEFFMKKTIFSAAAVAVVLIVAVVGVQMFDQNSIKRSIVSFGSDVRITRASANAFGNLATLALATENGKGGGGTASNTETSSPATLGTDAGRSSVAIGMGGGGVDKMIYPYYEPVTYKYVYKGDALILSTDKLDVLKKQAPNTTSLAESLSALGLGLVNLNSFPGSKVQSVSFNQDNGYNTYVDLNSGTISITGYYGIVPMADTKLCIPEGCPAPDPIVESEIPADDVVIAAANQFLTDHGISRDAYGQPEVSNEFRLQNKAMLEANPKSIIYWPDYVNVIYPLKIQNDEVFDESGNKMGLSVSVNVRNHKVVNVWNLSTQNYEASSYEAETNTDRILKVAEAGGMYWYASEGGKVVEIDLGTPTMQYVSMWDYQNNFSQQVLVPSLIFPVTQQPNDGSFYRKAVIVPLIKNILDRDTNSGGPIRILEGSGGTTEAVPPQPVAK